MNTVTDAVVACILAALLIVGGYQIYFLPQRWPLKAPRSLLISIDNKIPFWPQWAWVYSFLYYPLILSPILTIGSFRQYAYTAFNFALLLFAQVGIAYALPVKTPDHWRAYDLTATPSRTIPGLVQSIDRGGNCFPSMHVSVHIGDAAHSEQRARHGACMEDSGGRRIRADLPKRPVYETTLYP